VTDGKRDWKQVVLGWAIHFDKTAPEQPESPPADEVTLPQIDANRVTAPKDGGVDLDEVFDLAGINKEDIEHVRKAQDLVRNLPGDAALAVKRQIVETSLKTFGFEPHRLIEAAVKEIHALEAYIRAGAAQAAKQNAAAEDGIRSIEEQIATLKGQIEKHNADQELRARACTARKLEVQEVLEFFGPEEVGRVVGASRTQRA
jgi:hypothetical protein